MGCRKWLLPSIFMIFVTQLNLGSVKAYCFRNGNYTSNSTYKANLDLLLSTLPARMDIDIGFYNSSVGRGADTAYASVLCRGDVQLNVCRTCINDATAKLRRDCPNQMQAIGFEEFCTLRFSNESMFGILGTSPAVFMWNTGNVSNPGQFNEDLRALLSDLRGRAASGDSNRKVAANNITTTDFQYIFLLVQCTPDLSLRSCTNCLLEAETNIPNYCNNKKGCRVMFMSCNIRYEVYAFYNETRLAELTVAVGEPSPTAPPPSPLLPPPSPLLVPPPSPGGKAGSSRTVIIIVVVSVIGFLIASLCVGILIKRKKLRPWESIAETVEDISTAESLQHDFSEIKAATNDFADANKLGQGGFGAVYKGTLANGVDIAVKRLSRGSGQGDDEFKNEVLLISKLQHRNLVRLLGFSLAGSEKLLVYEFVQNASLDKFIFDPVKREYLSWESRYKIILGITRGLLYLHEDSRFMIIHRDLKAANILLDRDMNPKIADFGMARLFLPDETQANTSRIVGTYGYMAPEYAMHGIFSVKSDVFSFGVLILEILSGQRNTFRVSGSNIDLLNFAWKCWRQGTAAKIIDPLLNAGSGFSQEMLRCIHIALLCVQENAAHRPTMASVSLMLGSSSLTLAVPSEPAFFLRSDSATDASGLQELNSSDFSSRSSKITSQSARLISNEDSITELYPR